MFGEGWGTILDAGEVALPQNGDFRPIFGLIWWKKLDPFFAFLI